MPRKSKDKAICDIVDDEKGQYYTFVCELTSKNMDDMAEFLCRELDWRDDTTRPYSFWSKIYDRLFYTDDYLLGNVNFLLEEPELEETHNDNSDDEFDDYLYDDDYDNYEEIPEEG